MPATNRELMQAVERIVRPIAMSPARKMRMRTEFLTHLEAIYAEELAVDSDEVAAFERARRRFGDTAAMTAELRAGLCLTERLSGKFTELVSRKRGEAAAWYAARISGIYATVMALLMILAVSGRQLVLFGSMRLTVVDFQVVLAAVVSLTMITGGLLLFGMKLSDELTGESRKWSMILLAGLGLMLTYPAAILALSILAGGMGLSTERLVWNAGIGSVVFGFCGVLLAFVFSREAQERRPWDELSLDSN